MDRYCTCRLQSPGSAIEPLVESVLVVEDGEARLARSHGDGTGHDQRSNHLGASGWAVIRGFFPRVRVKGQDGWCRGIKASRTWAQIAIMPRNSASEASATRPPQRLTVTLPHSSRTWGTMFITFLPSETFLRAIAVVSAWRSAIAAHDSTTAHCAT